MSISNWHRSFDAGVRAAQAGWPEDVPITRTYELPDPRRHGEHWRMVHAWGVERNMTVAEVVKEYIEERGGQVLEMTEQFNPEPGISHRWLVTVRHHVKGLDCPLLMNEVSRRLVP